MKRLACLSIALLGAAAACGGHEIPEPELFLVRTQSETRRSPEAGAPAIRLATVDVSPHLRGIAMILEDGEVRTFVNQRYAAPVSSLVETAVTDRLRATGLFSVVTGPTDPARTALSLRIVVRAFNIEHGGTTGWQGSVVLGGTLEKDDERRVIGAFTASGLAPSEKSETRSFVRAIEAALAHALDELESAVSRTVRNSRTQG